MVDKDIYVDDEKEPMYRIDIYLNRSRSFTIVCNKAATDKLLYEFTSTKKIEHPTTKKVLDVEKIIVSS
jgi:hypothetical protein